MNWEQIFAPLKNLIDTIIWPLVGVLSVAIVLWGIYVGFRWVAAGDDAEKIKKARNLLKNTITGVIIAAVLVAGLPLLISVLSEWAKNWG